MYLKKAQELLSIVLCLVILIPVLTACSKEEISIQVPAMFFEGTKEDELTERSKELGISNVVFQKDQTITFTMSEKTRKKLQEKAKVSVENEIKKLVKGEGALTYIKDIKVSDSINEFTIMVDSTAYRASDNLDFASLYTASIYYQVISGKKAERAKASIIIKDNPTDTIIETF